jgi:aqualysin 1
MKKLCVTSLALILAAIFFHYVPSNTSAKSDKFKRSSRPVPNSYIVVVNPNSDGSKDDPTTAIDHLNRDYPGNIRKLFTSAIYGYSVEMNEAQAEQLSNDPRVKYVEEDSYVSETEVQYNPGWGLDRIDQHALPFDLAYNFSAQGGGVNVYILDSGILPTHVDLQGRVVMAFDAVRGSTTGQCNGHGTGVAGVVGSATFGVAKGVTLNDVRVLPCTGYGTVSDVIAGVDWVTRHAVHPAVANMSLQTTFSPSMNDAVAASISSGVTYVVGAGNNTEDACRWSPSSVSGAIVVGATNSTDARVGWSNFGPCVDIFAPGEGIATIWNTSDTTTTYASGTSFASPMVAGIAALYLQSNPGASPTEVANALTNVATPNLVSDPGVGSPNLLAYSILAPPPPTSCEGTMYSGSLNSAGSSSYQSSSLGFSSNTGALTGAVTSESGTLFGLSLEKKAKNRWSAVATSSTGQVAYRGRSGTYRWKITGISGGGSYDLCTETP